MKLFLPFDARDWTEGKNRAKGDLSPKVLLYLKIPANPCHNWVVERDKPRIIIFDIETLPNLLAALEVWPQLSNYPGLTLKATVSTLLCVGWKVYGEKTTHCIKAWDSESWETDVNNDYDVCVQMHEVLSSADVVVTHNGRSFDWKHIQTRFMVNGLDPLPKTNHIDTKNLVKQNLYLFNNRLNTAGKSLVMDKKLDHEGWDLWVDSFHRCPKALAKMEKYCKQDVRLTEKVFERLKPFVKATEMPNHNLFVCADGEEMVCNLCGSTQIQSKGYRYSATAVFKRYHCQSCKGYMKVPWNGGIPRSL